MISLKTTQALIAFLWIACPLRPRNSVLAGVMVTWLGVASLVHYHRYTIPDTILPMHGDRNPYSYCHWSPKLR